MQKGNIQQNLKQGKNKNTSSYCSSAMQREGLASGKGWAFGKEVKHCKYKFRNGMW